MASTWLLSLRVAFMSAGVLSTLLMLKLSLPVLVEFLNCEIPYLWSISVICLRPPYLYLVLNCIIITIVASSKLQPQKSEAEGFAVAPLPAQVKVKEDVIFADPSQVTPSFSRMDADPVDSPVVFGYVDDVVEKEILEAKPDEKIMEALVVTGEEVAAEELVSASETETENEEFVPSRSNGKPLRRRYPAKNYSVSTEKPLVSQRFSYRKSVKASPEGGMAVLGVTKPKRQDTLESTWRMITEGRPMPLTRHLKKSETWDTQGHGARHGADSPSTSPAHVMKKAETFNDRATSNTSSLSPSPGGASGRLKPEPSLSQDELNRRVEAFIRKFNEDMRLQRQESLKQYMQTVGSGSR